MGDIVTNNLSTYLPYSYLNNAQVTTTTQQQVALAIETDAASLPPSAQGLFLTMAQNSPSVAPGANGEPPANLPAALSRLESAAETLATCLQDAQGPAALAAVLIESTYSEQKNAIQEEVNTSEMQIADAYAQAAEDTAGANALKSSALTALVLSVVSSAIQICGAGAAIYGGMSAIGELDDLMSEEVEEVDTVTTNVPDLNDDDDDDDVDGSGGTGKSKGLTGTDKDGDGDDGLNTSTTDNTNAANNANTIRTPTDEDDGDNPIEDADDALKQQQRFQVGLKRIEAKMQVWNSTSQLINAVGQTGTAAANYVSTMGQATNQTDQAAGQVDAAQGQYQQQLYNIAVGIVQSMQSFVDAEEQAISGILQAETGEGAAVANAKANV